MTNARTLRTIALAVVAIYTLAMVTVAMLLLSPATTFEYMVLAVFAFSVVITALWRWPDLRRNRPLIANRSEIYQYFGFPTLGLCVLVVSLLVLRREPRRCAA